MGDTSLSATMGNSGMPTMSSREIADLVESRHDNVKRTIETLAERGVIQLPQTEEVKNHLGQTVSEYRIGKRDSHVIVAQLSPAFTARLVDRWQALEAAQTHLQRPAAATKITGELALLECFARLLRPAPSSQLTMLGTIAKQNGLDPSFLPSYTVDAPTGTANGSSLPTAPLTTLLRSHGITTAPAQYNDMLRAAGMLEQRTRKSTSKGSKHGEKRFWCVTERGLAFGKNLTNPASPRETQPHWYVDRFPELHRIVSARLVGAAQ